MPSAKMSYEFQHITIVPLSDKERISQTISEEHVGTAVSAMHRDGIVVLSNAVDAAHVDHLNDILCKEAGEMASLPTTHFNDNSPDGRPTGNMTQGPPLEPDLMYSDIWANRPAATVISSLIGPRPRVNYVNGNTALGNFNGARQNVHADLTFNHGTFLFALVANYYLTDVSPVNGSTELWLGSHRDTSFADHLNCDIAELDGDSRTEGPQPPKAVNASSSNKKMEQKIGIQSSLLEKRRAYAPPIQPTIPKGSVILRDLRLWHAGLPNRSPSPRIMLAYVYTPWWYQCPAKVVLPESARPLTETWAADTTSPVVYQAHFVPAHLDHKKVVFNPNFSSCNPGYLKMLPDLPHGFVFKADEDEIVRGEKGNGAAA